eukprot:s7381_g1.t1
MLQPFWDERRGYESRQRAREEALPLPLYVVAFFEQAVLQAPPIGAEHAQDVRLLTAFLLMLWGALRYSDLQRVLVSDLCCEDGVARAACWRIKRSASGMTFGDLTLGIIDNWTHRSQELIDFMKECDFLIAGPQRHQEALQPLQELPLPQVQRDELVVLQNSKAPEKFRCVKALIPKELSVTDIRRATCSKVGCPFKELQLQIDGEHMWAGRLQPFLNAEDREYKVKWRKINRLAKYIEHKQTGGAKGQCSKYGRTIMHYIALAGDVDLFQEVLNSEVGAVD